MKNVLIAGCMVLIAYSAVHYKMSYSDYTDPVPNPTATIPPEVHETAMVSSTAIDQGPTRLPSVETIDQLPDISDARDNGTYLTYLYTYEHVVTNYWKECDKTHSAYTCPDFHTAARLLKEKFGECPSKAVEYEYYDCKNDQ